MSDLRTIAEQIDALAPSEDAVALGTASQRKSGVVEIERKRSTPPPAPPARRTQAALDERARATADAMNSRVRSLSAALQARASKRQRAASPLAERMRKRAVHVGHVGQEVRPAPSAPPQPASALPPSIDARSRTTSALPSRPPPPPRARKKSRLWPALQLSLLACVGFVATYDLLVMRRGHGTREERERAAPPSPPPQPRAAPIAEVPAAQPIAAPEARASVARTPRPSVARRVEPRASQPTAAEPALRAHDEANWRPAPEVLVPQLAAPDARPTPEEARPVDLSRARVRTDEAPLALATATAARAPGALTIVNLEVHGSLATSVVRRAIERIVPQLAQCYGDSPVRPSARFELQINEVGRVRSALTQTRVAELDRCLAHAASRFIVVAPDTGTLRVSFSLRAD